MMSDLVKYKVKILRQRAPFQEPYWEMFVYEGPADNTVAGMLDDLNYRDDITDIDGNPVPRISWECSCLQGICGGCAMVINGRPALACETFLRDLTPGTENRSPFQKQSPGPRKAEPSPVPTITIEPLKKFMTISDLVVDRSKIQEDLLAVNSYIEEYSPDSASAEDHSLQYAAAKCLKCGLCLEVCPNYTGKGSFFGALFAGDCYLIASRSKHGKSVKEDYGKHFAAGCSKSFACMEVCPAEVPLLSIISKMNRK